jgi:hypothetical protein
MMKDFQAVQHAEAMLSPRRIERGIVKIMDGIALYFEDYARETESPIGEDGVIGEAAENMVAAVKIMLDGPTGRLDCGTLERRIRSLAMAHHVRFPE